jgi:hypothetical protein
MKAKENNKKLSKAQKFALLSSVAERLKNRESFPKRNEEARNFLKNVKIS